MAKIALSIEQMQNLKKLGCDTSKASMIYLHDDGEWILDCKNSVRKEFVEMFENVETFTLEDILEMLPKSIYINKLQYWIQVGYDSNMYVVGYYGTDDEGGIVTFHDISILIAAYKMLCWLLKNILIKRLVK